MKDGRQNQCAACHSIAKKAYALNNPKRLRRIQKKSYRKYYRKNKTMLLAKSRVWNRNMQYEKILWKLAKQRATALSVPFEISVDDIVVPSHCPALGITLKRQIGKPSDCSPTIDRIIPVLGYTVNNIVIVSYKANAMKRNATPGEMLQIAKFYVFMAELRGSAF